MKNIVYFYFLRMGILALLIVNLSCSLKSTEELRGLYVIEEVKKTSSKEKLPLSQIFPLNSLDLKENNICLLPSFGDKSCGKCRWEATNIEEQIIEISCETGGLSGSYIYSFKDDGKKITLTLKNEYWEIKCGRVFR